VGAVGEGVVGEGMAQRRRAKGVRYAEIDRSPSSDQPRAGARREQDGEM
jgi:3-hydroxyisobutyrate dehydrogenase-like beta-hydroxyacid dehydrogenase